MAESLIPRTRSGSSYRIAAVLFDFDGTLTRPDLIDFPGLKKAIGCPAGLGVLEHLERITDVTERRSHEAVLDRFESEAADRAEPNPGAIELVGFLRRRGIPLAILTRNRGVMVQRSLVHMKGIDPDDFAVVVSRDHPLEPKPMPDGVLHVAEELGVDVARLLVVGDHLFDVEAGRRAGALTMLLRNHGPSPEEPGSGGEDIAAVGTDVGGVAGEGSGADFVVDDLFEARRIIDYGLPLEQGKLPVEFLEEGLAGITLDDPSVLVGASIGEDAAVIDIGSDEVLVIASDPITLAADSIARYVVLANANDVATSGATPRWLLTTLMFPPGSTGSEIVAVIRGVHEMCAAYGISLCGGHTEITAAVSRPLVVGTMAGTTTAEKLLDKSKIRPGDRVLVTKAVAVEGTGLLAREYRERLLEKGLSPGLVDRCASFLDHLSILEEAGICRDSPGVSAMHDVTEGGLATALAELGAAGGSRLRVQMESIPVFPETVAVCEALGLDPLGLIGSGSLLVICASATVGDLIGALEAAGIRATEIGEVVGPGEGVEAFREGVRVEWPRFERDEVSRLS